MSISDLYLGVLELSNIREKEVDNPNVERRIATRGRYPPLFTAFSYEERGERDA